MDAAQTGRRNNMMLVPQGQIGNLNTITPCAACKLLRRRCAEECPFFPYFSPHEPHKFAAVHKVFGASNVSKLLLEVPESQRADTANSLVYEANLRLRDPIYGCMGAISALQQQVQSLQAELNAIKGEILKYKYREAATNIMASTHAALVSSGAMSMTELPSVPPPATPPPPRPPPPPSIVVSSSTTSSSSSSSCSSSGPLYALPSSTQGYGSLPNNNNLSSYFD
ncbi:hypothetical protein LguiA_020791 [Lonicera macranthoides]